MNRLSFAMLFALVACATPPPAPMQTQPRALIFSKTTGFRHDSIPDGIAVIRQLGQQNGFDADATEDAAVFTDQNLARYQTVVFLSTTGDIFNDAQQGAMERYIRSGGGFVGIHSAADTEYDWPWYGGLVGAYFQSHPAIQRAQLKIEDGPHPSTAGLPATWERNDEWYNFRLNPRGRVKVLARLDETTYSGGEMGADHPTCWCQLYDGGRAWYTGGGHTKESYSEPLFRQHLLGGIQFTARIKDGACSTITTASAASFRDGTVASESIAALFGAGFAATTETATTATLPTTLAGASVQVKDSGGQQQLAPLFFVSPTQINFQMPPGMANGAAIVTVAKADGTRPGGATAIDLTSPGLFAANANGQGVAAALALRVKADNSQRYESVAMFDPAQSRFISIPVDLGPANEQVFLILFGTGIRFHNNLSGVTATVGGTQAEVQFAGRQGALVGLDQVNLRLPRTLIGRGEIDVVLTVNGKAANPVMINIK